MSAAFTGDQLRLKTEKKRNETSIQEHLKMAIHLEERNRDIDELLKTAAK